jgi:hypothetical protein
MERVHCAEELERRNGGGFEGLEGGEDVRVEFVLEFFRELDQASTEQEECVKGFALAGACGFMRGI